jgi:hypothetical protein
LRARTYAPTSRAAIAQQFARTEAAKNAPIPSVFAVAPLKFGQGYDSVFRTSLNVSGHPVNVGGDALVPQMTPRSPRLPRQRREVAAQGH